MNAMPHDVSLLATVAVGFVLAFIFGFIANRINLPPLVGYLLAGVAVGPHTPGFVGDAALASQLAEIGVMLLMFGVGLHFSVDDLMAVRRIAVPGAIGQIALATVIGALLARFWGWSWGAGIVLGLSLSVASTVVLLKALEERNAVATPNGRIAVGWLIVEDLAMVLALVLLPALASALGAPPAAADAAHPTAPEGNLLLSLLGTLLKVGCFVAIVLMFGPKVLPLILRQVARTGSRELFTLCVLALALGIAFGSAKLFGVSYALGAFFAGVVLSESDLSHKTAANVLPLQDAFAVLFFVSVGMLFDPYILMREPGKVLAVLLLILIGKSLIALGIVLTLRFPISTGLTVAASLAQIGEFSFILAGLGLEYRLLPQEGLSLVLAGAILSITLNPLFFTGADWLNERVQASARWKAAWETSHSNSLQRLERELEAARLKLEQQAAAHKVFSPEELAQRFPLFSGLSAEQRETLVLHFQSREAQPGERIIRVGDVADAVYFISSGEVEVTVKGHRIKLGPGGFFGEMALLSGQTRTADVTALDYSKFLTLSQRDFREFLRKYPQLRRQIAELAAQRGEMNRQFSEELPPESPN